MELTSEFSLPLDADEAYRLLLDLDRVAPCLPGATLGAATDGDARELKLTVRLGPMRFAYAGTIEVRDQDAVQRRAVIVGSARETRGQGTAGGTIAMTVRPDGAGASTVESVATISLTGRAAQSGRGIVEDVSRQMIDQMAQCLAARCAPAAPDSGTESLGRVDAPPTELRTAGQVQELRGGRLLARVVWGRIKRLLSRR